MNEYRGDLARIHHEGHGDLARNAGPTIVRQLRQAGIRGGLVVDLGCGTGILARHLADGGYDVLGVDPSAAMLRIAARVAPSARFIRGRAEDCDVPACVAVVATGEALTYLPPRTTPVAHLRRHIHRVSKALIHGGLFVFDAIVEGGATPMTYRTWRACDDWAVLADVAEDLRAHVVARRITTFVRVRSVFRRSYVEHCVGVYQRERVLRQLRAAGFRARVQRGYGDMPLPPRRLVFVARLADGPT
jgi:SAM-dependent methyltransferase